VTKHLVVIGAGPAGEAVAKGAARRGARVTVVERADVGGVCLNHGCIPSKVLLESGRLLSHTRSAKFLGSPHLPKDWAVLQAHKNDLVSRFRNALEQRLAQLKVSVRRGTARFVGPRQIEVSGPDGLDVLDFDAAVIATGARPFFPPPFDALTEKIVTTQPSSGPSGHLPPRGEGNPGFPSPLGRGQGEGPEQLQKILDSDRVLEIPRVPSRLVVVGGGAVGLEFACLFQEWGSAVTVIEKKEQILPGEDTAVVRCLQTIFEKRGMTVLTETTVTQAATGPAGWRLSLSNGQNVEAEEVLVCVGRRPVSDGLGLEAAGVIADRGRVVVNEFFQTSQPHIYAAGDVNGLSLLAHAAWAQGDAIAGHWAGEKTAYSSALVPRCLYTWPEVASVGEWSGTVKNAKTQRFFFQGSAKALATEEGEGFIQIVSDKESGRLLGAQIIGPKATELIHIFSVALKGAMTAKDLRDVIFAHPTLAEGVREALDR